MMITAYHRHAPQVYHANRTWWGEYKWLVFVDDDVLISTRNLAAFLSAYDPDVPLWFRCYH